MRLLSEALSACLDSHTSCRKGSEDGWLPSRLIEIEESNHVRVVSRGQVQPNVPNGIIEYFTLSHVWGSEPFLTLTTENIAHLAQGIQVSTLPKCFQDAIATTKSFGRKYLWIDSLW